MPYVSVTRQDGERRAIAVCGTFTLRYDVILF